MECGSNGSDLGPVHEEAVHGVNKGWSYASGSESRMGWVELTETINQDQDGSCECSNPGQAHLIGRPRHL